MRDRFEPNVQTMEQNQAGCLSEIRAFMDGHYLEVTPFTRIETEDVDINQLWLRGGYPRSLLNIDDESSFQWREDYIRTFLERDIPQLGFHIPANTLSRFWRMLAHCHGQTLNASKLADSMGVSGHTIRKYIDLLEQTFVVRTLQPWAGNTKKRLVKSPKVYIRDSGLLHTLLDIESMDHLFAHPVYGASFEGFVIENILTQLPRWQASFYRTASGAEIDLVLEKAGRMVAIEIKASTSPKLSRGNWSAFETLKPDQGCVVAPVDSVSIKPKYERDTARCSALLPPIGRRRPFPD